MVQDMSKIIKIFSHYQGWGSVPALEDTLPRPMNKMLADWWKKMPSFGGFNGVPENDDQINILNGAEASTIKRCVPVLDSLTLGYGIVTTAEMYVKPYTGEMNMNVSSCPQEEAVVEATHPKRLERIPCLEISFHDYGQAMQHPLCVKSGQRLRKVFTPWRIMTPPGYSVILTEPLNNPSPFWEIVPGVIDSDNFAPQINFMMVFRDPNFEGIIPKGTPLAQVIPFKRESWKAYVSDSQKDTEELNLKAQTIFGRLNSVFRAPYRKYFWSRKDFK